MCIDISHYYSTCSVLAKLDVLLQTVHISMPNYVGMAIVSYSYTTIEFYSKYLISETLL